MGNHGEVFRASLSLPAQFETLEGHGWVNVAVKFADTHEKARNHFNVEVDVYRLLSGPSCNFLNKDWTGYVVQCGEGYGYDKHKPVTAVPLRAVVPKFFGYYEPAERVLK